MQRLGVDHPLVWNPCHLSQYVHSARSYHGLGIYRPTYCACKVDHRTCDPCQGSTADVECYLIFKSNQDQESDISLEHHMFLTIFAFRSVLAFAHLPLVIRAKIAAQVDGHLVVARSSSYLRTGRCLHCGLKQFSAYFLFLSYPSPIIVYPCH